MNTIKLHTLLFFITCFLVNTSVMATNFPVQEKEQENTTEVFVLPENESNIYQLFENQEIQQEQIGFLQKAANTTKQLTAKLSYLQKKMVSEWKTTAVIGLCLIICTYLTIAYYASAQTDTTDTLRQDTNLLKHIVDTAFKPEKPSFLSSIKKQYTKNFYLWLLALLILLFIIINILRKKKKRK